LRADCFLIRAQAMIRTDGLFVRASFAKNLRATRANFAFGAEKNIRTKSKLLKTEFS
jgi:hypothetical protein